MKYNSLFPRVLRVIFDSDSLEFPQFDAKPALAVFVVLRLDEVDVSEHEARHVEERLVPGADALDQVELVAEVQLQKKMEVKREKRLS